MTTRHQHSYFQRSLAGGILATLLLALWGGAAPGSLPSGSTEPVIDSVTPDSAAEGAVVTIRGANFGPSVGAVQGTSGVSFGGVWSTPSYWSDTAIWVAVPPGAATGSVVVTVSGQPSAGIEFTVTGTVGSGPAIGTVSPVLGPEGTVVTIRGRDFGPTAEMGGVSFNGVWASSSSWSDTEIRVPVPADTVTGSVVVTANGQASNGVAFIVPDSEWGDPAIESLSAASGPEGMVVTIEGENFGPSMRALEGTSGVSFNGVWGQPSSWSETVIQVPVPAGAPSGLVTVTVGGEGSNGLGFVVERAGPVIEAVETVSGREGARVEIRGRNFGPAMEAVQGWSGVSLEGVWGVPGYWSDREIHAAVPAGVSGGLVVVASAGQESNGVPFSVRRAKGMPPAPVVFASSVAPSVAPRAAPTLKSLNPERGPVGETVRIKGKNYGASRGTSTVTFNGTPVTDYISWRDKKIVVEVPEGATTGDVVVTVGGVASPRVEFTVTSGPVPAVSSLDPVSGPEGTSVEITGVNFGTSQGTSTVTFNGVAATATSWSDTSITAAVPMGATTGEVVVTVEGTLSAGVSFTVAPAIGSLSPDSGPEGTSVEIAGTSFGAVQGMSTVTFNGTAATATSWSDTSITVTVPAGATTGEVVVTVGGEASAGASFTVTPAIGGLSPVAGPEGAAVEITGTSFGAVQGTSTVTFNGTAATATSWSATSITVTVPAGAATGNVVVTVGGEASNGVSFTVGTDPVISGLNPDSGPVGTPVEITGANFGASEGTSTVTFNGAEATPTDWSATSITAPVPADATTGPVVVTVGGTPSNAVTFSVKPLISGLSRVSGPEGATVEITGAGFGAMQGTSTVAFNGTEATPTSWSATSITVTVPAGAATGSVVVTVDGTSSDGVAFSVTPAIGSLSPIAGPEGATVEITGTSFGAVQGMSTVTFNGTPATATSWSATSITVTVPAGATTGNVVVTVNGEASNGVSFTVGRNPMVISLKPAVARVETTVVIGGANFGATQGTGTVTFNGVAAAVASWSATAITVTVPASATTGPVVVTVGGEASNQVIFTVTGPPPEIRRLKPEEGEVGDSVRIKGEYFGTAQGTSTVTFNGLEASARSWNDGKIVASVPAGARTGPVVVTVEGQASNPVTFTVTGSSPSILSLDPTSGEVGTPVTITGVNFGAAKGTSTVTFNGVAATPTSWSASSITVPVPAAAATGKVYVTVGGQASNGETFTVTLPAPSITGLDPTEGRVGASVTISGENLGAVQGTSTVTFNGVPVETYTSWNDASITAPVPAGATTGNVLVTVGGQVSNAMVFTVAGVPAISSLSPDKGAEGTSVEIAGTSFGAAQGESTVSFNGTAATATNWSDTSITAAVPARAATGNVVVTVNGEASNGVAFTVTPAISSLSPDKGAEGTSVEITGTSFGAVQSESTVSFNGTAATATNWSDTSITVAVPAEATTGEVVVTVGSQASNGVAFTVTPAISSLSPDRGPEGASVEIAGTSFGATQGESTVTFNGTVATASNWSDTSITVAVPAGATTGNVVVTVGGEASNGVTFTVKPAISSLSPDTGPVGRSVGITGTSFGATQGTSTVTFNGTAATASSWSDTSITVAVPAGATTGNVVVTVGGEASGGVAFTVTPAISSLSPDTGPEGTSVEITGTSFGATQGTSTVSFNGTAATPTSWSATSITVAVPAGATTGDVVVTVDGEASDGVEFTVTPAISSLSPDSGPEGTTVEISGTSFGATQGTSTVSFNGVAATPSSWSGTSITVAVPATATTGNVIVTVGGQASNGMAFTVVSVPAISSLNPDTGPEGTSVTIAGANFGDSQGTSTVSFNGVAATPTSWSDTSITAAVPTGATTGDVVVTVDGEASDGAEFAVTPAISGLNATSGPEGTSVEITGTGFGATQGASTVSFNGTAATPTSWGATSITVTVPAGATTGDVVVTVDGEASNGVTFTVTPAISGLSPASGPEGTSVEITGTSFGPTQGTGTVSFNGTAATPTSWSATSITAAVPAGATTGNVVVTVDGEASNGVTFTVTPAISGLSPASGPEGTSVEITGTSFGPTQGTGTVSFNGTAATPTSWSATSITAAVPAGATTGNVVVTVDGEASNGVTFTVTPSISGLNPASGPVGASVEISGTTFGDSQRTSTVTFNGTAATPTSWSDTSITVTVPAGATTGDVVVTVGGQASNGVAFTVKPSISGLNPSGGPVETSVGITGTSFGATQGTSTVTFNGTVAAPTSWDDTSITVEVPAGATTGNVVVTVDGQASNGVTFTVTENRAPETEGPIEAQTVNKGASAELTVSSYFSDPDEDDLEYTAVSSDTAKVTVAVSGAVVTLSGVAKGDATVTVTASDGDLTAEQAFTVTVPNGAPVCRDISTQILWVGDSQAVNLSEYCSDPDGHRLTYSARSLDEDDVTVTVSGSRLTLTGVAVGSATIRVTATDQPGDPQDRLSTIEEFTARVKNRDPDCDDIADQTVKVGQSKTLTVSCSDGDGHSLAYSARSSDTSKVTESMTGSSLRLTGVAVGSADITVTVTDGHGGETTETFRVTVVQPNRPPVCNFPNQTINVNASKDLGVNAYCTDPDGDDMTYTSASSSNSGLVSVSRRNNNTTVRITGVAATTSPHPTVTVRVEDEHGAGTEKTFRVTVVQPNRPPVCNFPNQTINVNASKDLGVNAYCTDPDGDDMTYTSASSSNSGLVSVSRRNNNTTVRITGVAATTSPHPTVTVRVEDEHGAGTEKTFRVTVVQPNRPPVCNFPNQTINVNASKDLGVNAYCTDPDGDDMTYTSASSSNSGLVSVSRRNNNTTVRITGVAATTSPHPTVTVRVEDEHGAGTEKTFRVTVVQPNRPPVCNFPNQTINVNASKDLGVNAYCTDPDGDDMTYTSASSSNSGLVSVSRRNNNTTVRITGVAATTSPHPTVTVRVEDEHGAGTEKTFRVTVVQPNRPPVCNFPNQTINVNASKDLGVNAYCTDPDGDDMTYTSASSSNSGLVSVSRRNNNTTVRITGVAATTSPHPTVTVRVEDEHGAGTEKTFRVTVVQPNRPPVCNFPNQTINVNASKDLGVNAYCTDPDGDDMTYTSASSSNSGLVSVSRRNNNTTVRITGVAATTSPHPTVTVRVEDEHGAGTEKTFRVTVVQPNRPPVCNFPNQTIDVNASKDLGVNAYCTDPDGDDMTYTSASSSNSGLVSVSRRNNNTTVRITGESGGTATVTVTVEDEHRAATTKEFDVTVNPRPPAPRAYISASSTILTDDGCTRLTWSTENAASASISPGVGVAVKLNKEQSHRVCPDAKETYELTAIGEPGAIPPRDTARVTVWLKPPTASLTADPTTIFPGERTTLSWTTTNAESGSINTEAIASTELDSGSKQVRLDSLGGYSYTLSVLRAGAKPSTAVNGAYVTVVPRPPSPTASLTADSTTITEGGCTDLRWETEHAERASINQGIGTVTPTERGSIRVCPDSTEIYELTATGAEGAKPLTATASVTVTVNPPRPSSPVITSISPSLQRPDDPVTISGNHFGTTSGSVSFGGHSVSIFSGPGYSWSNTSISLLIPGSLHAGQVSVTVTTSGGTTSSSYSYTVTGGPVSRGDCEEGDEDCPEGKEDKESGESDEGGTDEDPAEGGG